MFEKLRAEVETCLQFFFFLFLNVCSNVLDVITPGRGDGQEIRSGPPSYFLLPSFTLLRGFPLISFPFSHLPSSLQRSGELDTSVGSSDRCHPPPPPPAFSSSLCPPSVLPILPPAPHQFFKSVKFTGIHKGRERLIS